MSCVKITCLRWTALFVLGVQYGIGMAFGVTPQYIATALSNPTRPSADRLRDPARKPDVCLALAGIKPGDRIADVYPGGGYYSRLFSLVVGPQGRVYALVPQVLAARTPQLLAYTRSQFGDPAYHNVEVLETPLDAWQAPQPLDVVWMGQVYHDMPNVEMGPANIAAMNRSIYRALKPGGIYVVTDHAAALGSGFLDLDPDMSNRVHRIDPAIVKQQVLAAGFVLEADRSLLANPADPHTTSIFDASIRGHTDQFFFVFRKPR